MFTLLGQASSPICNWPRVLKHQSMVEVKVLTYHPLRIFCGLLPSSILFSLAPGSWLHDCSFSFSLLSPSLGLTIPPKHQTLGSSGVRGWGSCYLNWVHLGSGNGCWNHKFQSCAAPAGSTPAKQHSSYNCFCLHATQWHPHVSDVDFKNHIWNPSCKRMWEI